MYMHIYIYIYIYIYIRIHVYTCIYIYVHRHRHNYMSTYILLQLRTYMGTYVHRYMYVNMHNQLVAYIQAYIGMCVAGVLRRLRGGAFWRVRCGGSSERGALQLPAGVGNFRTGVPGIPGAWVVSPGVHANHWNLKSGFIMNSWECWLDLGSCGSYT